MPTLTEYCQEVIFSKHLKNYLLFRKHSIFLPKCLLDSFFSLQHHFPFEMANIHDLQSSCRLLIDLHKLVGDLDKPLPHPGLLPFHSTQGDWLWSADRCFGNCVVCALLVFFMRRVKERNRMEVAMNWYYQWAETSFPGRDLVLSSVRCHDLIVINDGCNGCAINEAQDEDKRIIIMY